MTDAGARFLTGFGAELSPRGKRIFCRPCLDWSERRYHVAGLVGAEIWRRCLALGWFTRERDIPRAAVDRDRKGGAARCLWRRPEQRWSNASRPARRHDGRQGAAGIAGPEAASSPSRRLFFIAALSDSDARCRSKRALPARPAGAQWPSRRIEPGRNKHDCVRSHSRALRAGASRDGRGGRGGRAGLSLPRRHHRGAAAAGRIERSARPHGRRAAQRRLGTAGHHRQPARRRRQCRRRLCGARAGRRLHADGRHRRDDDLQRLPLQEHAVRPGEGLRADHQCGRQHHRPRGQFAAAGQHRCRS